MIIFRKIQRNITQMNIDCITFVFEKNVVILFTMFYEINCFSSFLVICQILFYSVPWWQTIRIGWLCDNAFFSFMKIIQWRGLLKTFVALCTCLSGARLNFHNLYSNLHFIMDEYTIYSPHLFLLMGSIQVNHKNILNLKYNTKLVYLFHITWPGFLVEYQQLQLYLILSLPNFK